MTNEVRTLLSTSNYRLEYLAGEGFSLVGEGSTQHTPYRVWNTRTDRAEGYATQMQDGYNFIGNAESMIGAVTEKFGALRIDKKTLQ